MVAPAELLRKIGITSGSQSGAKMAMLHLLFSENCRISVLQLDSGAVSVNYSFNVY